MNYETELVKATDFVTKPCPSTEDKYVVECGYCNQQFKSQELEKALTREGVHRAKQHVNQYTKITTAKADYDPTYSILEDWFTVQLYNIDVIWWTIPSEKLKERLKISDLL